MEEATKKGHVEEFFCKKLQWRPGQPMAELVNIFEKAVLDLKDEGLFVELQEHGLAPFRKEHFDPGATRACAGGS